MKLTARTVRASIPALLVAAASTPAEIVQIDITGVVEYNLINGGELGEMNDGDPVTASFRVNSNNFVDSQSFPTRAYPINLDSFAFTAGSATPSLLDPQPGTPYFVIRNNDPAVDGFFLSYGTDLPVSLSLNEEGAFGSFGFAYQVTMLGTRLSSVDIMNVLGTYGGYTNFHFGITDGSLDPAGFIPFQIRLSAVPCRADWNDDGTLDAFDYDDFVSDFFNYVLFGTGFPDYNDDGTVDAFDYDDFVSDFFTGCD